MKKPFLDTASSEFRQLRESGAVLVDKSLFIRDLLLWRNIFAASEPDRKDMQAILAGQPLRRPVNEATQLFDLPRSDALWSLMVLSGYLKATAPEIDDDGLATHLLSLPNREVAVAFRRFTEEPFAQANIDCTPAKAAPTC